MLLAYRLSLRGLLEKYCAVVNRSFVV